jgi:hypothetical protein
MRVWWKISSFVTWKIESMVEKNPKKLCEHARLLGTTEYDGTVFFKGFSDLEACLNYSYYTQCESPEI